MDLNKKNMSKIKFEIPTHDPYTGELNPHYEEITGEKNPLEYNISKTSDKTDLEDLNDYLIMVSNMNNIGVRRKLVLIEGYVHKLKNKLSTQK